MSSTEIYGFRKSGYAFHLANICNAWRGAMAFKEADFLPANRFVRKTLSIFEPVRAALKTLERR